VLCISYGTARFMLEYLRDDPERGQAFGFSTSQLISLCIVPLAGIAYSLLRKPTQFWRRS
jgi:prolipoprotein diacylglyceryltransferase